MSKLLQILLVLWAVSATRQVVGQTPASSAPEHCGTLNPTREYLATHPVVRKRLAAIEAHTQQYSDQQNAMAQKPIGPPPALLVIPVVVHVIYSAADQNLSDAIIKDQIEVLNQAFRGPLSPGPGGATLPAAFAPYVGDVRVQFCLATRDPNGNSTTGITRRNNTGTQYTSLYAGQANDASLGGINAWNTAYYLNIWCCNLRLYQGFAIFPGMASTPGEDGVYVKYNAFGRGHAVLNAYNTLGRTAVHEVGHWLNARHIWGDDNSGCTGSDTVSDTPNQDGPNEFNPTFPHVTCGNGPDGDMFMNHMDYVQDDSKLMFSAGQALRMQAIIEPGGYRESLRSSPGLNPTLGILGASTLPTNVYCGDRTEFRLRAGNGVGCGGGTLQYEWSATNGWAIDNPTAYAPTITPSGSSGSTITLAGTYTNLAGVSFTLSPVSISIGFYPATATPVFTSGPARLCSGASYTAAVSPVAGATSYHWTMPAGFSPAGQLTTSGPSLTVSVGASVPGGFYLLTCATSTSGCSRSATASVPLTVNGGPPLKIVDSDLLQRTTQGIVCQRNRIFLELVPVTPPPPGALNGSYSSINWSVSANTPGNSSTPFPLQVSYSTPDVPNFPFTVTATYYDACSNFKAAVSYSATTAPAGSTSLGNSYNCNPYQWRPAAPASAAPYPNPAANTLQLPSGYQGVITVYSQQGKLMHSLLAPAAGVTLDTRAWPEGLYVVTGRNPLGEFERHTVQIQH